jgi:hypothetical protein
MPVHDWTRVEAGVFHDFHTVWIGGIRTVLNDGLLPPDYYALAEQHIGRPVTDVLTLHASPVTPEKSPWPPATGGTAVDEAPPRVRHKQTVAPGALALRRTLSIRHVSGHRLVAMLEIVSSANKDRALHVEDFATKAVSALDVGVHLMVVDLLPPGSHDPHGMHGEILQRLEASDEAYESSADEPLTLASYAAGPQIDIYVEPVAVGAALPDMPLFLRPDRYVSVPLESTYQDAYRGLPAFWRGVLEGQSSPAD